MEAQVPGDGVVLGAARLEQVQRDMGADLLQLGLGRRVVARQLVLERRRVDAEVGRGLLQRGNAANARAPLASIGLTIPAVAIVSLVNGWTLTLGIDVKSTVLLLLSIIVTSLSLGSGRTTIMQGTVLLMIFAVYLFVTVVP